jgi:hypothetical protein
MSLISTTSFGFFCLFGTLCDLESFLVFKLATAVSRLAFDLIVFEFLESMVLISSGSLDFLGF